MRRKIETKLRLDRWSPEQISGWLAGQNLALSHERISPFVHTITYENGKEFSAHQKTAKSLKARTRQLKYKSESAGFEE